MVFQWSYFKLFLVWLLSVASILICAPSVASDYEYGIYASYEHSDNIYQNPVGNDGEIYNYGLDFLVESSATSITYTLSGDMRRREYHEQGADTAYEDNRGMALSMLLQPVHTNFSMLVLDSYFQVPKDRTTSQEIGNLDDVNVFSILPSYNILISPTDRIETELVYSVVDEFDPETKMEDSSRKTAQATLGYERDISSLLSLGLHVRHGEVKYDVDRDGYKSDHAIVRLSSDRGLTRYELNLGRTRLTSDNGLEEDSDYAEFSLYREVNRNNVVGLFYREGLGQEINLDLSDASYERVINDQSGFVSEPVRERQANLNHSYDGYSWDWATNVFRRELQSIEGLGVRDEATTGVTTAITVDLGNNIFPAFDVNVILEYGYNRNEFIDQNIDFDTQSYSLEVEYQIRNNFSISVEALHRTAKGNLPLNNTEQNSYLIGFRYSPRGNIR